MTDLKNGKLSIFESVLSPETTLSDFKLMLGNRFHQEKTSKTNTLFTLKSSEYISILSKDAESPNNGEILTINNMSFSNISVVFKGNYLYKIILESKYLHPYILTENGQRIVSQEKIKENLDKMNEWAISTLETPTQQSSDSMEWVYEWGSITTSGYNSPGNSKLFIEYNTKDLVPNNTSAIVLLILSTFFCCPVSIIMSIISLVDTYIMNKVNDAEKFAKVGWITFFVWICLAIILAITGFFLFCKMLGIIAVNAH